MRDRHPVDGNSRRRFLKIGGLTLLGGAIGLDMLSADGALASVGAQTKAARELLLHNTHTGESARLAYWSGGRYLTDGLAKIDHILRDHRTGETRSIDPDLLDLLHDLAAELGVRPDFEIISGYRSEATNAALRRRSRGVASKSYHMLGKAADVRLAGVTLSRLHRAALGMKRGGVGLYSGPGFVHVDTGPVRTW